MSNAPLPRQVDARKLAAKGAEISADVAVETLPRIRDLLANDKGHVAATLRFYTDEEHVRRLDGHLSAELEVICQRCLEPMPLALETDFALGIVWSEDDAGRLSGALEPLIVGEEFVDLADVVSEELILSLPYVNYHSTQDCHQTVQQFAGVGEESVAEGTLDSDNDGDNPFKVLEQLKQDK